ncbi:MAG: T9SS type A sorting domain-containing protein, partial [Bacteroidota bacterium]
NEDDGDDDDGGSGIWLIAHAVTCEEVCRCSERPGPDDGRVFEINVLLDCNEGGDDDGNVVIGKSNATNQISRDLLVKAYPNPTSGQVVIKIDNHINPDVDIRVMNIAGQRVFEKSYKTEREIRFDLSDQVSGMYMILIEVDNKRIIKNLVLDRK